MALTLVPYPPSPEPAAGPEPSNRIEEAIDLVLASPEALAEIAARNACPERSRRDGWTPERIATFIETLADTGIVADGYRAAGMSKQAAYDLRNRDPVFAAAWRAAQTQARPLVADGLLERSITGTVEHYYRDGELVGERRHYESWLGLAVLKRLDKMAEEDRTEGTLAGRIAGDWQAALDALRAGGTGAVTKALEDKVDQLDSPPSPPGWEPWDRCWQDDDGQWLTDFPPPPGFTGFESGTWDGFNAYTRACTAGEVELVEAHAEAMAAHEQAELTTEAEAERDGFFARLRAELNALPLADGGDGSSDARQETLPSC